MKFIQSLVGKSSRNLLFNSFVFIKNPQDICLELKACDKTLLEKIQITSSDSEISVRKNFSILQKC